MYYYLIIIHSILRWVALVALVLMIGISLVKHAKGQNFSSWDNLLRHWTATFFHIQFIVGVLLLIKSPLVQQFWSNVHLGFENLYLTFFALVHPLLMLTSVVLITIGSAKAKRINSSKAKFKTILIWYSISLLILFLAIPWSFSPIASRPNFPTF